MRPGSLLALALEERFQLSAGAMQYGLLLMQDAGKRHWMRRSAVLVFGARELDGT